MKKVFWFVFVLAILFVVPLALAYQGELPPEVAEVATPERVIDMAFLLAITGFFKAQFDIKGRPVIGVAFLVGLFLWFIPEISAINPVVALLAGFVKWFLGALGSFDTLIDVQEKFKE